MRTRSMICLAIVLLEFSVLGVKSADAEEPASRAPHQTLERALEFIVKDAAKWRADHGCVTCRQGTMTVWALSEAKQQGYVVDPRSLDETICETKKAVVRRFSKPREPGIQLITSAFYLGIMSQNLPILSRDEMRQLAEHLARFQEKDGTWETSPPFRSSSR